jgi:hypothetical protein
MHPHLAVEIPTDETFIDIIRLIVTNGWTLRIGATMLSRGRAVHRRPADPCNWEEL